MEELQIKDKGAEEDFSKLDDDLDCSSDESLVIFQTDSKGRLIRLVEESQKSELIGTKYIANLRESFPNDYRVDNEELEIALYDEIHVREYRRDLSSDSSYFNSRGDYVKVKLNRDDMTTTDHQGSYQDFGLAGASSMSTYPKRLTELDDTVWIADTGASVHMTNTLKYLTDVKEGDSYITVGSGEDLPCRKVGRVRGYVLDSKGKQTRITLERVKYVPDLCCNLLSLTTIMKQGFSLYGKDGTLAIGKGLQKINFTKKIRTATNGELFGLQIYGRSDGDKRKSSIDQKNMKKVNFNVLHSKLGHACEAVTRAIGKMLNLEVIGKFNKCEDCAVGKAKMKPITKYTVSDDVKKGER